MRARNNFDAFKAFFWGGEGGVHEIFSIEKKPPPSPGGKKTPPTILTRVKNVPFLDFSLWLGRRSLRDPQRCVALISKKARIR